MGWLLRRFFRLWVRAAVQPAEAPASLTARRRSRCVTCSSANPAPISRCCATSPSPAKLAVPRETLREPARRGAALLLRRGRRRRFWDATITRRPPPHLLALVEALRDAIRVRDVLLVPTAVYWGRAPQKERSWLRLLFVENWAADDARAQVLRGALQRPQRHGGDGRADQPALAAGRRARARTRPGASRASCAASCGASARCASGRISRTAAPSSPACCVPAAVRAVVAAEAREKHDHVPARPAAGAQVRLRDRR